MLWRDIVAKMYFSKRFMRLLLVVVLQVPRRANVGQDAQDTLNLKAASWIPAAFDKPSLTRCIFVSAPHMTLIPQRRYRSGT